MKSMAPAEAEKKPEQKQLLIPTASAVLPNGELVEMVYDPVLRKTQFVVGTAEAWGNQERTDLSPIERLVSYSATNNLVKDRLVVFPSEPAPYDASSDLVCRISRF